MKLILDSSVEIIINLAKDEVQKTKYNMLTAEHIMLVILQIRPIAHLFESLGVNANVLRIEIEKFNELLVRNHLIQQSKKYMEPKYSASEKPKQSEQKEVRYELKKSESFARLIESAYQSAARDDRSIVGLKDLLLAFTALEQHHVSQFPFSKHINFSKFRYSLRYDIETTEDICDIELGIFTNIYTDEDNLESFFGEGTERDIEEMLEERKHNEKKTLDTLTTNVGEKIKLQPNLFIGQDQLLLDMYEVLMRKQKNNVIIVGDAGVGKTAIVEEFAKRLNENNVPDALKDHSLLSLNVVSLVAGTRYRGDFEDRVKQLIEALAEKKHCILFLDDVHSMISAGASTANSNDFGDLIKPLLVDNIVQCIGATTHEEFKILEKEKGLLRRFNILEMKESTEDETISILRNIKDSYQDFFNVRYSDEVLQDIVYLSNKYINERAFPDKAIDILDCLGANTKITIFQNNAMRDNKQQGKKIKKIKTEIIVSRDENNKVQDAHVYSVVSTADVEEMISKITKRNIQTIKKDEFSILMNLSKNLSKKIFGQKEAVETLSKAMIRSRSGLRAERKPIASLLFVGPTGVGKTELSKQLAVELGLHFQRFDMSEYQEQHTISKFIGSPPGYVGHAQGSILIDSVRRYPNAVLLLDEIEKAHKDVFNLLLQIMDYATITDSVGMKADFRNVIIIMTSNAGAQESASSVLGFEEPTLKGAGAINDAVHNLFSPEFRNRLDETIVFSPLQKTHIKLIVLKELQLIQHMILQKNIHLEWDSKVVSFLVNKGFNQIYGARNMLRVIEEEVKDNLAEFIIRHQSNSKSIDKKNHKLVLLMSITKNDYKQNEIAIHKKEEPIEVSIE